MDWVLKKFELPCEPLPFLENFHTALCVFRHHQVFIQKEGSVTYLSDALLRLRRLQIADIDPHLCQAPLACPKASACGAPDVLSEENLVRLCKGHIRPNTFQPRRIISLWLERGDSYN